MNKMCYSCKKYLIFCKGEENPVYTGCARKGSYSSKEEIKRGMNVLQEFYGDNELDFVIACLEYGLSPSLLNSYGLSEESRYIRDFGKSHGLI